MSSPLGPAVAPRTRLAAARAGGRPHEIVEALAGVARASARHRAFAAAESSLQEALRWATVAGGFDLSADLHCLAGEIAATGAECPGPAVRRAGSRHCAVAHAAEAGRLAGRVACPSAEVVVLLRASDVLDRCGERDEAVLLQVRAVRQLAAAED